MPTRARRQRQRNSPDPGIAIEQRDRHHKAQHCPGKRRDAAEGIFDGNPGGSPKQAEEDEGRNIGEAGGIHMG